MGGVRVLVEEINEWKEFWVVSNDTNARVGKLDPHFECRVTWWSIWTMVEWSTKSMPPSTPTAKLYGRRCFANLDEYVRATWDATIRWRATGMPIGRSLSGFVGSLWSAKKYSDRREVFTAVGSSPRAKCKGGLLG
eukprot:scaffold198707_cov50-Attheya_sp.AAC.1